MGNEFKQRPAFCRFIKHTKKAESDSPAELEEDLLKDQNWTSAAQYGERLTSKQRVGHARKRCPKQRLYGTLPRERERQREVNHGSSLHSSSSSVCFLLCFLWWLLPADLQMWWLVTCRHSTRKGQTPNTADWLHLWCHSTGREFSSGRRSPNHQKPWQTEDETLLNQEFLRWFWTNLLELHSEKLSNNKTIKETSEDNLIKRSFCNLVMTQRGSSNARFRPPIGWLKDDD